MCILTVDDIKLDLINYLKEQHIDDVVTLWSHSKHYMINKYGEMGGAYASFGKDITVIVNYNKEQYRFIVSLEEIKSN